MPRRGSSRSKGSPCHSQNSSTERQRSYGQRGAGILRVKTAIFAIEHDAFAVEQDGLVPTCIDIKRGPSAGQSVRVSRATFVLCTVNA
jgi:hypothetical protein